MPHSARVDLEKSMFFTIGGDTRLVLHSGWPHRQLYKRPLDNFFLSGSPIVNDHFAQAEPKFWRDNTMLMKAVLSLISGIGGLGLYSFLGTETDIPHMWGRIPGSGNRSRKDQHLLLWQLTWGGSSPTRQRRSTRLSGWTTISATGPRHPSFDPSGANWSISSYISAT